MMWPFGKRGEAAASGARDTPQLAATGGGEKPPAGLEGYSGLADLYDGGAVAGALFVPAFYGAAWVVAQDMTRMICSGGLRVEDEAGKIVETETARKALRLLTRSPDGGVTNARSAILAVCADYAIRGDGLIAVERDAYLRPQRLIPLARSGATTSRIGRDGVLVYHARRMDAGDLATTEPWPQTAVVRAGYPDMAGNRQYQGLSRSPLKTLANTLGVARSADEFMLQGFKQARSTPIHANFRDRGASDYMSPEQRRQALDAINSQMGVPGALVTFDDVAVTTLNLLGEHKDIAAIKESLIRDILRFFALPPVYSGLDTNVLGSGYEAMKRQWWTSGLQHHVDGLLSELSLRLLPATQKFAVDPTQMIRGDSRSTAALLMAVQGDGQRPPAITVEEQRKLIGLNPSVPDDLRREPWKAPEDVDKRRGSADVVPIRPIPVEDD